MSDETQRAAATQKSVTVRLPFFGETKQMIRYGWDWNDPEKPDGLPVDNLYIRKHALRDQRTEAPMQGQSEAWPHHIQVVIQWV